MVKRRLKVFLCHARDNATTVYTLYENLKRDGFDPWIDREDLTGGQEWEHEIHSALSTSDVVIICLSWQFNQKGFRQKELKIALKEADLHPTGEIFIIPVRLQDCDVLMELQRWQWVDLFEKDGYEKLLKALDKRAEELGIRKRKIPKPKSPRKSPRIMVGGALSEWLSRHNLKTNPFGNLRGDGYPFVYPEGVTRPVYWETFVESTPMLASCPTSADAQALAFLLRRECMSIEKAQSDIGFSRLIFPISIDFLDVKNLEFPHNLIAYSAARLWLDVLSANPDSVTLLSGNVQNELLELLFWSVRFKPNEAVIKVLKLNGIKDDEIHAITLINRIKEFKSQYNITPNISPKTVLQSWLKIRPFGVDKSFVILSINNSRADFPNWWYEKFNYLIPKLLCQGVFTKVLTSGSQSFPLRLPLIDLLWSDDGLYRSLDGQFDVAMDAEKKSMGVAIRFNELFGPGVTEEQTTAKLISASHNSLARMLTLGNRLLQYHCEKRGISEKYLYVEDLQTILNSA